MVLRSVSLPAHHQHTHTVIFLHGRGSNAREFSEELWENHDRRGDSLQHIFPSVRWVFPQADESYLERFQEYHSQWFDIWGYDNPDERRELQLPGLKEVTPKLIRLIQAEASVVGLQNVVLAGISQGCTTALHALLNYPIPADGVEGQRLCAFIGLSSWMSLGSGSVKETRELLALDGSTAGPSDVIFRNTPTFISHNTDDQTVPVDQGKRLRDILTEYGMDVTWREYPTGGHWINMPQCIDDVVAFLKSQGLTSK
ncbi:phospholipase/carboxylesterase family protein [Xylariaceae sp. FL1019]|nr:phospholipase/carboxylesterase family protein [Xylariaceae sp. FL1019]